MRASTDTIDFFFEDGHVELASTARTAAEAVAGQSSPREMARSMGADHDLYRLFCSADSVDLRGVCLVREALGYHSPVADSILAVHGLGTFPVAFAGSDAQRDAMLSECRRGERVGAFALTEPSAGSDVASLSTHAVLDGDDFILDGEKTFISNVGIADYYVVFANARPELGKDGITAFVVERGAAGLVEEPFEVGYDHPIGSLKLCQVRVPRSNLLGEVGQGFTLAMATLDTFRVSVGAAALGMATRALDESLAHVRERVQFGRPLSTQPVIRSQIADMATQLEAARLLVYRAARLRDRGEAMTVEAAMAKLYATEAAFQIIDRAVQLFGGRGVRRGETVEALYRAIRPLRIYEGTSEIQRLIIGRGLAKGDA